MKSQEIAARSPNVEEAWEDSDGMWIHLKRGWFWESEGQHIIHELTWKAALAWLKRAETGCSCFECKHGRGPTMAELMGEVPT